VVQDPTTGALYVSNIVGAVMQKDGNGYIAKLKPDGTLIAKQWVKGLNAPTGMALHDRTLYVADVDQIVEVNAASGEIVKRYDAKGAIFLNDVAVDEDGTVYASDTPMNTIWRLKDGSLEPWLANDALNGPNGLLVQDGKLIVASFGKLPGEGQKQELGGLLAIDIEKQAVSKLGNNDKIGNLDGLQALQSGAYLITDWDAGGFYRIDAKGKVERLLKLGKGSADFIYLPDKKLALIPIMLNNSLVAYTLD
jgi:sugar lactone lactonase YvrE